MNWSEIADYAVVVAEMAPFTDLVSDVYLLVLVWPSTRVIAPLDVLGCWTRSLWYLALALTVVGTLVDLMPEALLMTEILMHPGVLLAEDGAPVKILKLFFSDGKPIVAWVSSVDATKPRLLAMQKSLRRRFSAVAAGLDMRDAFCTEGDHKRAVTWKYSGIMGMLICGEILTAVGASLFVYIDPKMPAILSLVASIFALLMSTRANMTEVKDRKLHLCPAAKEVHRTDGGRGYEFLLPGPLTFIRCLLLVPVWPMLLVYVEQLPFWQVKTPVFNRVGSADALWIWPLDWLSIQAPSFGHSFGNLIDFGSPTGLLVLLFVPHLLWTVVAALRTLTLLLFVSYNEYFNCSSDGHARRRDYSWGFYFTLRDLSTEGLRGMTQSDQEKLKRDYSFHRWSARVQGMLGLGFSRWIGTMIWAPLACIVLVIALLVYTSLHFGRFACVEQEWAFVYGHVAWWAVIAVGHHARRTNVFSRRRAGD